MIRFLDIEKIIAAHGVEIEQALLRAARSGRYILGGEDAEFERRYAHFIGTRHAIGCGNGLDAIKLIFKACIELGMISPGDEVIVPANTFIASFLAVEQAGLIPVAVEPDAVTCQINPKAAEAAITPRTKAILLVHLYGRCAYSDEIEIICSENNLLLIEDNAQAHGCRYKNRRTGSLGLAAAHSFYPGKNLGALGDAGAVTTDNDEIATAVRQLANYGSQSKYNFKYAGYNSRLDELQAAVLGVKLGYLDSDNARRKEIAAMYLRGISNPAVILPPDESQSESVWHIFPVFTSSRDELQRYLADNGVETLVHYPVPPHRQECFSHMSNLSLPVAEQLHATELSLPISPVMTDSEVQTVINLINRWQPQRTY